MTHQKESGLLFSEMDIMYSFNFRNMEKVQLGQWLNLAAH